MLETEQRQMPRDTVAGHEDRPAPKRHRTLGLALILGLLTAAAFGIFGVWNRQESEAKLAQWTKAQAIPTVAVVKPARSTKSQELVLPGDIEAYYEAPIYARVPGYLKMWYKDIGAHVTAGEQLAVIDAPDLDQQLEQAKHDLVSVRASASLADLTAKRWHSLLASQSVSQQTADEKEGDAAAKRALVAASQANVDRLQALENFKYITAPFDGVVTARETDIGALINAGSSSGVELFKVADIHRMRVYVRVPQAYASQLKHGMEADLKLAQYPHQVFKAILETTSNSIAKESRTVLVELMVDNPDGKLWPGTFAEVHFQIPPDTGVYHIPTSALVFREHGLEVATLGADNIVALKPVTVGRDLGAEIEVVSGLGPSDRVIDNPSDSVGSGDLVRVAGEVATDDRTAQLASTDQDARADQGRRTGHK
jgi:RND family efflux transporter MFP subunit